MSTGQENLLPPPGLLLTEQREYWRALAQALYDAIDPGTLDAIASEIGGEFQHSARANSLRVIARQQRKAIAKAEGRDHVL